MLQRAHGRQSGCSCCLFLAVFLSYSLVFCFFLLFLPFFPAHLLFAARVTAFLLYQLLRFFILIVILAKDTRVLQKND